MEAPAVAVLLAAEAPVVAAQAVVAPQEAVAPVARAVDSVLAKPMASILIPATRASFISVLEAGLTSRPVAMAWCLTPAAIAATGLRLHMITITDVLFIII